LVFIAFIVFPLFWLSKTVSFFAEYRYLQCASSGFYHKWTRWRSWLLYWVLLCEWGVMFSHLRDFLSCWKSIWRLVNV